MRLASSPVRPCASCTVATPAVASPSITAGLARSIRATGGNSNLSVNDPAVDALVDKAVSTTDETARNKIWAEIDKKVMDDAFILPGVWAKGLLYRPNTLTNVMVSNGFQQYDYLALGVNK